MTNNQFRAALDRLGLSQAEAARTLGIDKQTVWRYTQGERGIPEPTAKLIRLLLSGKVSQQDVDRA